MLERVRVWLAEAATAMLPKDRADGVTWRLDWMPMPVRDTVRGRVVEAEVARPRIPGRGPVAVGVKVTWRVQLVAGARDAPGVGQSPAGV